MLSLRWPGGPSPRCVGLLSLSLRYVHIRACCRACGASAEIVLKRVCGARCKVDVWAGVVVVGVGIVRVVRGWVGRKAVGSDVLIKHVFDSRRSKVGVRPIRLK